MCGVCVHVCACIVRVCVCVKESTCESVCIYMCVGGGRCLCVSGDRCMCIGGRGISACVFIAMVERNQGVRLPSQDFLKLV